MKLISVVGARPNFMKIAPFCHALEAYKKNHPQQPLEHILVHTGQHYDDQMSTTFFESLSIPPADINLGIGSGTHAEQVGRTMIAFEKVLLEERPDWVIVVGDVNATLACSVTAKKLGIKVAHIEAGLRSHDMTMPEEINRLVTDRLSDALYTPDRLSSENLEAEGVPPQAIEFVGNIMIDTLEAQRASSAKKDINEIIQRNTTQANTGDGFVKDREYGVVTLHRPATVDDKNKLEPIVEYLCNVIAPSFPLIWPIHPRTVKNLERFGLLDSINANTFIHVLRPLEYHDLLRLNMTAKMVFTDSGGLQEECCVLGTPCLTLRNNTERPITLREHDGASILVGTKVEDIQNGVNTILSDITTPSRPELWDGHTATRIVESIISRTKSEND